MALTLLGKKVGMTQWFDGEGKAVPATVVQVEPSVVVQLKRRESDGYTAIQLGWGGVKEGKLPKPLRGHFHKVGVSPRRKLYEARVDDPDAFQVGQELLRGRSSVGGSALVPSLTVTSSSGVQGPRGRWASER